MDTLYITAQRAGYSRQHQHNRYPGLFVHGFSQGNENYGQHNHRHRKGKSSRGNVKEIKSV
jgi:hypothetical protein